MQTAMAYCGLKCDTCQIHLATIETDSLKKAEMRVSIAKHLSEIYGTTAKPEIISDCDGCKVANGRLFTGCADCNIRKCAVQKIMINCAYCNDYPCDYFAKHFTYKQYKNET